MLRAPISIRMNFLIELLNPLSSADDCAEILKGMNSENWEGLTALCAQHDLLSALEFRFSQLGLAQQIPEPHRQSFRSAYMLTAARNILLLNHACQILLRLRAENIPVIALKGLFLLENIYKDVGARSMSDLDILVHREDLNRTIEILQGLGYQLSRYFDIRDSNLDIKHVPPMTLSDGTHVEIHWTLLEEDEPFTIAMDGVWQRSFPAQINGIDVLAEGIEDLLLHLCIHLTYQHYLSLGLKGMFDIALVLQRYQDQLDWPCFVALCQQWRAEKTAALTLELLRALQWAIIPEQVLAQLSPTPIDERVLTEAYQILLQDEHAIHSLTPDLVHLASESNHFKRLSLMFQRIFLPRIIIARLYQIPPSSPRILWGYFLRLKDLIKAYGGTVQKITKKDPSLLADVSQKKSVYELHEWLIS